MELSQMNQNHRAVLDGSSPQDRVQGLTNIAFVPWPCGHPPATAPGAASLQNSKESLGICLRDAIPPLTRDFPVCWDPQRQTQSGVGRPQPGVPLPCRALGRCSPPCHHPSAVGFPRQTWPGPNLLGRQGGLAAGWVVNPAASFYVVRAC